LVALAISAPFLNHWKAKVFVELALAVNVAVAGAPTVWLNGFSVMIGSCGPAGKTVKVASAL